MPNFLGGLDSFFMYKKNIAGLLFWLRIFTLFILRLSCSQTSKLLLRTLQLLQWFEGVRCGAYAPLFRWLENQIYGCRKMDRKIATSMGVISAAVWGILKCRLKRASGARRAETCSYKIPTKNNETKRQSAKKDLILLSPVAWKHDLLVKNRLDLHQYGTSAVVQHIGCCGYSC